MLTQAHLTRFVHRASRVTPAVPRAGSAIRPPIRGVARLRQTFLPDFLYGGAMYRGEFLRELEEHRCAYDLMQMREFMPPPPRAFFCRYPDMNVQGPGPWSPQERGGLVSWGPGLDGFNAAVAANAAATAANAGSEHASNVAGDAGAEDTADADTDTDATCLDDLFDAPTDSQSTSGTTAVSLSSHSSLPSLLDALTDDEGPRAAMYVLSPAQQRHLREILQSGEGHEAASDSIQRSVMGVKPE
ncbi:hypothetical protein DFH09DRAFT_1323291 [Mycena vulgaris]|nr:hypothetical protein DFH09DRAFT_1323291 [Mycena vulgaris]